MGSIADKAALDAATVSVQGDNFARTEEGFLERCADWGAKKGAGDVSKAGMLIDCTQSAWMGDYVPSLQIAAKAWDAFRLSRLAKSGKPDREGSSRAARISDVHKMMKVGALPLIHDKDMGGYGTIMRAQRIIREQTVEGEQDELLLKVGTLQLRSPAVPLHDDQIAAVMAPPMPKEKGIADKYGQARAILEAIGKKFPEEGEAAEYKTLVQGTQDRIDFHGGAAREIKAREAEARKKLAKKNGKRRKK